MSNRGASAKPRRIKQRSPLKRCVSAPRLIRTTRRRKLRAITEWLRKGDRVQLTLRMRGREQAHPDVGRKVLSEMASAVGDVGRIERDVLWEGRRMTMVLAPNTLPVKGTRPPRQASAQSESISSGTADASP